ncbi:LysR family transcriptional regulator [Sphingomonas gilva]|uniref:LysR family transcriptional regulator n=1 Tax=Sphingomonas gilva TaxID=2305907 RepID=A0A396RT07_9SPHN|nr:LysR family transcriptional regulator [Sphingomonas gilva]RHW19226.1 LysR family transcriptional regulator [Sphingomonas gilva]
MNDMFDLNLRHLRAIPLIGRRNSMSAAARATGLSQPALTQGLAKVERQLGARLFERRSDGMVATEEGAGLSERIDLAFAHLADAVRGAARGGRGFTRPDRLMTATQLRAFLALAQAGSFVEAARATGLSQPALHRAVRDLEQLGALPLVERRGRGVVLTREGRRLARGIRLARAEIDAGIAALSPDTSFGGRIVIGAMPLSRALLLPAAIAALIRAAPRATVDVVEGSWRELVEPLRDGVIDLMIGALREPPGPVGLEQQALFEDRLAVVARAGHPLVGDDVPDRAALARYPWIVGSAGTPLREHWRALFAGGPPPPAPIECGSVMTIRGILLDSDCLTLLSPDQIALEVEAGLLTPIGPPRGEMRRTIGLTTRAGWRPSLLQARFVDLVEEYVRTT